MENNYHYLKTGLEVTMECPAISTQKGKSTILGWRGKKMVFVDAPRFASNIPITRYVGANWIIRYVHEGTVVGFKTRGVDYFDKGELFLMKYPETFVTHSLRNQMRVSMNIPVMIQTTRSSKGSKNYKGISMDVSTGGIRVKFSEDISDFKYCFLSFQLPGGESFRNLECEVSKTEYVNKAYEIGMKFVNIDEEILDTLGSCLAHFSSVELLPGEK